MKNLTPAKHRAELSPRSGYLKAEGFCEAKTETPFLRSKSPKAATGLKPTPPQHKPFGHGSRFSRAAAILRTLTLSALLALPAASALAQSQTFHEIHHPHGRLNPNNQGGGGTSYQGRVIHIPDQEWINYHGALAWNDTGATGISENARSQRAAEKEALDKCNAQTKANGTSANSCRIAAWTRNGCMAAAFDGQGSGVGAEGTREEAEAEAMRHCQSGGRTCVINYSKCFHPVRIR